MVVGYSSPVGTTGSGLIADSPMHSIQHGEKMNREEGNRKRLLYSLLSSEDLDGILVVRIPLCMIWEAMEDTGIVKRILNREYENMVNPGQKEIEVLTALCSWSNMHNHYVFYTLAETRYFRYRKFCTVKPAADTMEEINDFFRKRCLNFLKRTGSYRKQINELQS